MFLNMCKHNKIKHNLFFYYYFLFIYFFKSFKLVSKKKNCVLILLC